MYNQMTPQREFVSNLTGVFGFPVTPFRKDLSLNLDGLARNVDEMAAFPFCALVAAGGTGEMRLSSGSSIAGSAIGGTSSRCRQGPSCRRGPA